MLRERSKWQAHRILSAGKSTVRNGRKPFAVAALVTTAIVSVLLVVPAIGMPVAAASSASKTPRAVSSAVKPRSLPAGASQVTLSGVTHPSRTTFSKVALRARATTRTAIHRFTLSTKRISSLDAATAASAATTTPPAISSLAANPPFLTPQGGMVIVSATVSGASTCKLSASLLVSGLPENVACTSGAVSTVITLPANLTTATKVYTITLTAVGSTTVKATTVVDVAGSGPAISGFSATPPSVANTGGAIVLGASILRAKSCVVSVAPALSGLPETVACPGGGITVTLTLPGNTNTTAETYQFTLAATGTTTVTATTAVSVAGTASGQVVDVSGTISANTTWSPAQASAYVIEGSISVPGDVTLTIDPGTVVKGLGNGEGCNNVDANICVVNGGALDAIGTASQPIIFTSANDNSAGSNTGSGNPSPGDWAGITVDPSSGIDLEYAVVEYDGGGSSGAGLYLQDTQTTLRNDTMENVAGVAYVLDSFGPFDNISSVTATGSGTAELDIVSRAVNTNTTLLDEPIPWVISPYLTVPQGVTLTVAAGAVVKSLGDGEGCNGVDANICVVNGGALVAIGTASQPIVFTSANDNAGKITGSGSPSPGDWAGILVDVSGGIDLEYADVKYDGGGSSGAGLYLQDTQPTLRNDTMENVAGVAYVLDSFGPFDNISSVTATGSGTAELDIVSRAVMANTTLLDEPIPWVISPYLTVPQGVTLTVDPGAVVKSLGDGEGCNGVDANICVVNGGALDAIGTASQPIVFTSANDNAGKITGSGKPSPGDWAGILVDVSGGIDLEYADVKYDGGGSSGAGLYLQDTQPTLRNDTMENVAGVAYVLDSFGPFDNISSVTATGSGTAELDIVSRAVMANTTLLDEPIPWVISPYLTVPQGVTLTVAAGAVVKSLGDGEGCNGVDANICVVNGGALVAIGTASQPIVFTSANDNAGKITGSGSPSPGDWAGILVDVSGGIDLEYADVKYDGGGSSGAGLYLQDTQPTLRNDTMENVAGVAYVLDSFGPFDNISSVTATGSGTAELDIVSRAVMANTTLLDEPIPWVISPYLTVPQGVTLTVDPGAVVKSLGDGEGCNGVDANICVVNGGALVAKGTPTQPVAFTSANDNTYGYGKTGSGSPSPGDWAGITIDPSSGIDLEYAHVKYDGGGSSGAGLYLQDPQPTLRYDTMENVNGVAYELDSGGPFDNISGVTATGSGTPELDIVSRAVNTNTTLLDELIPWVISPYLTVPQGVTLTVDPGAVVKSLGDGEGCNNTDANICVVNGGALVAKGSKAHPIVFTSLNDPVGAVTSTQGPSPGDWAGIAIACAPAVDANTCIVDNSSVLRYDVFEYASSAVNVGLLDSLQITDSVFSYNQSAAAVQGTTDNDPVLAALDCVPPYLSVIDASTDWFGSTGYPGADIDLLGLLGIIVPDEFSSFYGAITTYGSAEEDIGDNLVPWTVYTCPELFGFPIPVSPVIFNSVPTYPLTNTAYEEKS